MTEQRLKSVNPKVPQAGYFLSADDGRQLRAIGRAIGFDFDAWLADRAQSTFVKRRDFDWELSKRVDDECDSTYAHLRAVVENCKTATVDAIRYQLVGLLPEVRTLDPDEAQKMRDNDLGHLVERQEWMAQGNWSDYGYGESPEGWKVDTDA